MKKLNEWIFRRNLQKHACGTTGFPHWDKVRAIIVLYESDIMEKNPFIKQVVTELQAEGKDVTTMGYVNRKDVSSAILPQSRILGTKDFNIFGDLRSDVRDDIRKRRYDLLIDLSLSSVLPLRYMALYLRADFKAGCGSVAGIHNLMIDVPVQAGQVVLFQEIIRYLKMIKSND